jgi:endogenous inhibitor of DNA gyrase (YacG/DUF329 family)
LAARIYQQRTYERIKVQCDYCGKELEITAFKARSSKRHFCDDECYRQYLRKDLVHLICPICGKPFTRKKSAVEKSKDINTMTCSVSCCSELRKTLMNGERNHQYGKTGDKNASWKSDERTTTHNYKQIRVEDHPFRDANNFVLEHRLIAEQYLLTDSNSVEINGRKYLKPECVVHHIDFNKQNNSINNLYVFENESMHILFHNLHKSGRVSDLQDFFHYYQTSYVEKLYNYEWLYKAYIIYDLSVSKISQLFNLPYKSIEVEIYKHKLDEIKKGQQAKEERLKFIMQALS